MADSSSTSNLANLASYVEQIAEIQSSIQEHYAQIGRLRQEARADGCNMEAVHQLGLIVAKSPHDGGSGLLVDISKYAQEIGLQLDGAVLESSEKIKPAEKKIQEAETNVSSFTENSPLFDKRLSLWLQFALGVFVSGIFIWLLH